MSPYELQTTLKAMAAFVEKIPASLGREIEDTANGGIEDITGKISRVMETCKQFEATLDARQNELCKQIDDAYAKVRDAREAMRKRLSELPQFELPFCRSDLEKIDGFCQTAERLTHLSPLSWERMLQLAKAFSEQIDAKA